MQQQQLAFASDEALAVALIKSPATSTQPSGSAAELAAWTAAARVLLNLDEFITRE